MTPPSFRGLLVADEWLLAASLWLAPVIGLLAVADATFLRFGRPAAIGPGEWAAFHGVLVAPGLLFVGARAWALWRIHTRSALVSAKVGSVRRAPFGGGWYVHLSYDYAGTQFTKRFFVQSVAHYRSLVASSRASVLVDPTHPQRSFLAVALRTPFAT